MLSNGSNISRSLAPTTTTGTQQQTAYQQQQQQQQQQQSQATAQYEEDMGYRYIYKSSFSRSSPLYLFFAFRRFTTRPLPRYADYFLSRDTIHGPHNSSPRVVGSRRVFERTKGGRPCSFRSKVFSLNIADHCGSGIAGRF